MKSNNPKSHCFSTMALFERELSGHAMAVRTAVFMNPVHRSTEKFWNKPIRF